MTRIKMRRGNGDLCDVPSRGWETEFRNGIVPEWEGVTGLGFVEDFMGVGLGLSSILGIGDL
jgi:hypothetical protein